MTISLRSSRDAAADKAVVFAVDRSYLPFALLAATQIARMAPSGDFDICVVTSDPAEPPAALAKGGIRFCRLDTGSLFDGLMFDARRSAALYARLALPEALARDYRRILYLDADIFVQTGDFSALLDVDLGAHSIAAVRDNIQWRTPERMAGVFRCAGLEAAPYFNSGVLLIDTAEYNKRNLLRQCLALGREKSMILKRHDQDMLNVVLHNAWAELAPVWNWQYTKASMMFEAMECANIVHFIGSGKPWLPSGRSLPLRFRRVYGNFLAEHFPEETIVSDRAALCVRHCRSSLRRSLFKHFLADARFRRYLDRFETDLTVLHYSGAIT